MTPDSFSDGGRFLDPEAAILHGRRLLAEGADVLDIGGESTRPGAQPVTEDEELRRVLPVVKALAPEGRVSIDTRTRAVAEAALAAGATILNDVSASLAGVAAEARAGYIAMHMQGTPETMQAAPSYSDVAGQVRDFLVERASAAREAGVAEIWIDPGLGFGKTADHNLTLLRRLRTLTDSGFSVLVGASRKGFLGHLTDGAAADDRVEASLAVAVWAMTQGASMLRVHDVAATVEAVKIVTADVAA